MKQAIDERIVEVLKKNLPTMFRRADVDKLTGGVITASFLRNLATTKPELAPVARRFGKFVVYDKEEFLNWLELYYGSFEEHVYANSIGGFSKRICRRKGTAGEDRSVSERSEGEGRTVEGIFDF